MFNRRGVEKDGRSKAIELEEIEKLAKDRDDQKAIILSGFNDRLKPLILGKKAVSGPEGVKTKKEITEEILSAIAPSQWKKIVVDDDKVMQDIEEMIKTLDFKFKQLDNKFEEKKAKVEAGDEMLPGVLKVVKCLLQLSVNFNR